MYDFSTPLADAVKKARGKQGLTQEQVAEKAHVDSRSVLKIENCNSNPELATLWPIIRVLSIDPLTIFYPGMERDNPRIRLLQQIISDCSDQEADALIPIIRELIGFMRSNDKSPIN